MAINKLRYNMDGLEKVQKSLALAKGFRAQIGIFENKDARAATGDGRDGNADIGAKHEFGFTTEGGAQIPARSFLRMPIRTHLGEIAKMMENSAVALLLAGKLEMLFSRLGIACRKTVDQAFQTSGWGTWAKNSPWTVLIKGSNMPLIDTSQLRRSVDNKVKKP